MRGFGSLGVFGLYPSEEDHTKAQTEKGVILPWIPL